MVRVKPLRSLKLVEHKHTGKLIHHSHTSHMALVIMLAVVGFFIYISQDIVIASQQTGGGSMTVSLIVPGDPPATGAQITSPRDGTKIKESAVVSINGTCAARTFVAIYNNSNLAGSTHCTEAGIFQLDAQLVKGQNIFSSLNFDNLNQPGPTTTSVTIYYIDESSAKPFEPSLPIDPLVIPGTDVDRELCDDNNPNVLTNCETKPIGVDKCEDYKASSNLTVGGEPHVAVVCVPKFAGLNESKKIGLLVWGGISPYALNIKWGEEDTNNTLVSLPKPGYVTAEVRYEVLGAYNVRVVVKDSRGQETITETGIEVIGSEKPQNFLEYISYSMHLSWFDTPVPMYLVAVAITLGFWGGDLFDRQFGARRTRKVRS